MTAALSASRCAPGCGYRATTLNLDLERNMKISDLKQSRFLTKEDCDPPITATISHVDQDNVAPADQKPEMRYVLHFKEPGIKPLVLNMTNGETIASITGSDDSDGWASKRIVLYHEPNVGFAGKRVGGIRVRESAEQKEAVTLPDDSTDDIPW